MCPLPVTLYAAALGIPKGSREWIEPRKRTPPGLTGQGLGLLVWHGSNPRTLVGRKLCKPTLALALAIVAVGLQKGQALAGGGAATDSYDGIRGGALEVHGIVDVYAQHAFKASSSGTTQLRAFDVKVDQALVGTLRLTLAHKPDILGFRLDLAVGELPDNYLRDDPAATAHPGLSRGLSYVEQGFVTATIPVGRGLQVDVGKFGTPVGLEDNEALANWNYSRSLLYLVAEPSYHAGLRLTYPAAERLAVSLFWVNGWDVNVLAGNGMRSLAAAISWKPAPGLEVVLDYMGGPERAPTQLSRPALAFRSVFDAYARLELTKHVAFAWTGDYGEDAANGGVSWWGVGGYLRLDALGWLAASLRGEHYDDGDGFTTGAKQRLAEGTATVEAHGRVNAVTWIARIEARRDQSDAAFFASVGGGASNRQDTLGVSLLAAF